jgi:hypothetical protein
VGTFDVKTFGVEIIFERRFPVNSLYQSFDDDFAEKENLKVSRVDEASFRYSSSDFSPPNCFIFVDGTIQNVIGGKIKMDSFELLFNVFLICVGAGYENGELIESKISKCLFLHSENGPIFDDIFGNMKEKFQNVDNEHRYEIYQLPKGKDILEYAMNLLREKEFEFIDELCEKLHEKNNLSEKKYAIVIDGNIRLKKLKNKIENLLVVGVVKNPLNLYQSENDIRDLKPGDRTNLFEVKDNRSSKSKFSFFLKLMQNKMKNSESEFIRVDFSGIQDPACAVQFSDFIKSKILSFSSSIGERAPQNLVPFRILEKRIRAILGDEKIRKRKIQKEIMEIMSFG